MSYQQDDSTTMFRAFDMETSAEGMRPYFRFVSMVILLAVTDYCRSILLDKRYANKPWEEWTLRNKKLWRDGRSARRWMLGMTTSSVPFYRLANALSMEPEKIVEHCERDPKGTLKRAKSLLYV